jgi:NitT/TauT family transport system substrate-binding protein
MEDKNMSIFERPQCIWALTLGLAVAASISGANAADLVRIGVGIDAAYAPFYIADHRGLFKNEGVDVTVSKFTIGSDGQDAMIAGQMNVSGAAEQASMIRMGRADVTPLVVIEESGTYLKLVAGSTFDDIKAIKTWGIVKGSSSEYLAFLALKKEGIDPAGVKMLSSAAPELPALLARGDIDGYFAWEPWPSIGIKNGAKKLATSKDVGYVYTLWITVMTPWLRDHESEAKAVIRAVAEACRQITADPKKAANDLQAETKLPAADTVGFLADTKWGVRNFAESDFKSFDQIADFVADRKMTKGRLDYKSRLPMNWLWAK